MTYMDRDEALKLLRGGHRELVKRDGVNPDVTWLKDESIEEGNDLPAPDAPAAEIADDLRDALEQPAGIAIGPENK